MIPINVSPARFLALAAAIAACFLVLNTMHDAVTDKAAFGFAMPAVVIESGSAAPTISFAHDTRP